jgi:uncharacterized membrane protein YeaQ/YmgE (transglycosylase-associated protein family)
MLFSIFGWIIFGLIVGAIARFIYPGGQDLGILRTSLLGIAGSFVGGFLGWLLLGGTVVQASGWVGSIVGAILVLAIASRQQRVRSY